MVSRDGKGGYIIYYPDFEAVNQAYQCQPINFVEKHFKPNSLPSLKAQEPAPPVIKAEGEAIEVISDPWVVPKSFVSRRELKERLEKGDEPVLEIVDYLCRRNNVTYRELFTNPICTAVAALVDEAWSNGSQAKFLSAGLDAKLAVAKKAWTGARTVFFNSVAGKQLEAKWKAEMES